METTLIPYGAPCSECWRATICPACGAHIANVARKDFESFSKVEYGDHWRAEHRDLSQKNIDRVIHIINPDGSVRNAAFRVAPDGCPNEVHHD